MQALGGGVVDHSAVAGISCDVTGVRVWPVVGQMWCVAAASGGRCVCWGRRLPMCVSAAWLQWFGSDGVVTILKGGCSPFGDGDEQVAMYIALVFSVNDELVFMLKVGCLLMFSPPRGTSRNCHLEWISPILHLLPNRSA